MVSEARAVVPKLVKTAKACHQSIYDRSFAVTGPRLWDILPSELNMLTSQQDFKDGLTNFLFLFPDNPPVQGYKSVNDNSLLDWNDNRAESLLLRWSQDAMAC